MASTSLQVAGLASNFDWKSFVDQIMSLEHAPADRLAAEKIENNLKVSQLSTLGTKLSALQDAALALKADGLFGQRLTTFGTTSTWSSSAAADTATGTYKIAVSQLATAAKLTGTSDIGAGLNTVDDDVSGLTLANLPIGQAVTAGTFTVNGQQITVALTDSLQDVFDAIHEADSNLTASYDHTTDRITISAASGTVMLGAANDTSNFLRALKLGNNGTGTVTSSANLGTVKTTATLASANLGTAITNADGSGNSAFTINGVSISYNVNTDTLAAVMTRINNSGAGVTASYDAVNDRVVLANATTGDLGISVSETGSGLLGALGLTGGTFTRGQNALFTVNDGDTLSSASNTLDATSHGITGLSVTVKSEDTQTLTVSADTATMRSKIEAFVTKFNDVQQFLESATKISTDSKGKVTAATLADNREIQDWAHSLRGLAFAAIGSGTIKRLNDLGIDFKSGTNELEIEDGAKLDAALATGTDEVEAFFSTASTGFAAKFDSFLKNISDRNDDQQTNLNKANTSLDDQIAAIERRLEQERAIMEAAFIQMENAQSKLKQQQTAVENMFASNTSSS
jgi:flagellar hook-associated protein 2